MDRERGVSGVAPEAAWPVDPPRPVAELEAPSRSAFVTRTYLHLYGAIVAFTLLEAFLFTSGLAAPIARAMFGTSWLLVLGGFIVVSWIATHVAHRATSLPAQYLALAGYVVAEAIVFVPLLFVAQYHAPGTIESAALVTLVGFGILTAVAMWTRQDLSFLRAVLPWAFGVALLLVVSGVIFGFELGPMFSVAMIGLAGVAILYDTSNVLHHYPEDRYVGASLELFASVALMFWYVLRLFLASRD
jgi:FtsH-binding integral membrane protein